MYKVVVLIIALLATAAWSQPPESAQDQTGSDKGNAPKEITATGCLQQSGAYLYLIQDDGTQIQVSGPKLDEYRGHQVEVSGERGSKAIDTTVSGAASSETLSPVIKVRSVRDLAATCDKTSH